MTTTRQLVDEWTGRTSKGTVVAGSLVTALRTLLYERESVSAPRETFYWVTISSPVASENWTYRTTKVRAPFVSRSSCREPSLAESSLLCAGGPSNVE